MTSYSSSSSVYKLKLEKIRFISCLGDYVSEDFKVGVYFYAIAIKTPVREQLAAALAAEAAALAAEAAAEVSFSQNITARTRFQTGPRSKRGSRRPGTLGNPNKSIPLTLTQPPNFKILHINLKLIS